MAENVNIVESLNVYLAQLDCFGLYLWIVYGFKRGRSKTDTAQYSNQWLFKIVECILV